MVKKVKKIKVHSLTGRIDDRLMMQAFKAVKRNRGAAGIDKVSIAMFEENLEANLAALKPDLKTKTASYARGLRIPGVSAFEQVTNDETEVAGEIQDEGSGDYSAVS